MVFHVTNYMRETNVWMIRKMRWILWSLVAFIPLYRNFYWDYLGRRVALKRKWNMLSEEQVRAESEQKRADWGYKPRYEPLYNFSIKRFVYEKMTPEETIRDAPRLVTNSQREK